MAVQYFLCTLCTFYCQNNLLWHEIEIKKQHGTSTTIRTQRIDIHSCNGRWNNININIYNCNDGVDHDVSDNNNNANNSNNYNDNNLSQPNIIFLSTELIVMQVLVYVFLCML